VTHENKDNYGRDAAGSAIYSREPTRTSAVAPRLCIYVGRIYRYVLYINIYIYIHTRACTYVHVRAFRSYITAETTRSRFDTSAPRHAASHGAPSERPASSRPSSRPGHYDCQANANGLCIINGPRATTGRGSHDTRLAVHTTRR